jgi:hypothetical protein
MALKKYNVTVRCFSVTDGFERGEEHILPVDSPDEEHAVSAAMSNAIAFTTKVQGGTVLPIAFICTGVQEREDS